MDDLLSNIASQIKTHLTNLQKDGYGYIETAPEKKQSAQSTQTVTARPVVTIQNDKPVYIQPVNEPVAHQTENTDVPSFNINNEKNCLTCALSSSRQKDMLYGHGSLNARLMLITETPDLTKNSASSFLSGKKAVLLSNILKCIGLDVKEVYLTYLLKCSTPSNRNPVLNEVEKCKEILYHQIDTIKPKVICSLGALTTSLLLNTGDTISNLRGKTIDYRNSVLIPTFHPAYLLRSPQMKKYAWKDMLLIKRILSN